MRQAGDFLRFVVTDQGTGMPDEVLRRIGEPFFTTKEPGKGMGLGTFLVRTLAEQLGGRLHYESAPKQGTSAILELPRGSGGASCMMPQSDPESDRAVLVMDDDDVFRNRLCRALEERGWSATGAGNGVAALEIRRQISPDLAVVDLRLPGMRGLEIVRALRELDEIDLHHHADRLWQHRNRADGHQAGRKSLSE